MATINTGTGTLGALDEVVQWNADDADGTFVAVTGTWAGTITFQVSVNGTDWVAFNYTPLAAGGALASTLTANSAGVRMSLLNVPYARVRMTAYTSGTANIQFVNYRNSTR